MSVRKVALVTGSATGIGRATAVRFAKLGYDVVVNYSRSEAEAKETLALVEAEGVKGLLVACNIGDDAAVKAMFATIAATFGGLDVLVNNAGTTFFVDHKNLDEMSEDKWDQILQVNVKGTFFCIRAAAPLLKARGGNIVSVSSVAGISGDGSSIAYAASKGAVNTMTKSLAKSLAPEIRVNAVCPGPVDTPIIAGINDLQGVREAWDARVPMGRFARPEEIAAVVAFLASDDASYMTGSILAVDGGVTAHTGQPDLPRMLGLA